MFLELAPLMNLVLGDCPTQLAVCAWVALHGLRLICYRSQAANNKTVCETAARQFDIEQNLLERAQHGLNKLLAQQGAPPPRAGASLC